MFEKFTEKALNVVTEAQKQAKAMNNAMVQPEHILLAIVGEAKGIALKIFRTNGVTFENLKQSVEKRLRFEKASKEVETLPFSTESKMILKKTLDLAEKSGNHTILYEHLFLVVMQDKTSYISRILEEYSFDVEGSVELMHRLIQKKLKRLSHPEEVVEKKEDVPEYLMTEKFFDGKEASKILERAVSKMTVSNYEILGTEQIMSSILEDKDSQIAKLLQTKGITDETFEQKLAQKPRNAEFEDRQIIFTPNAFIVMNNALQIAKERGSSEVTSTHMLLGLLKSKKGLAYNALKEFNLPDNTIEELITKPIEKQMSETQTIMQLAKQEARRLGRNEVGTEMFLLGIIAEATGIGAKVLTELEVTIKDARLIVEDIIGYGDEYFDKEIVFTDRAKKVLETAWTLAKKSNSENIKSEHLLYAITTVPECIAMKSLAQLGVDVLEIKQGILKEAGKSDRDC